MVHPRQPTRFGPAGPWSIRRMALPLVGLALPILALAPVLGRGFVLTYDMVFAPTHALLPDSIGTGSTLPRAVPVDAVVALATAVVAGDILQKLLLFATLAAATIGAGRLVPTDAVAPRLVAAVTYGWSAYVAERLFIGHWSLLIAYAMLPWVAAAALAMRQEDRGATARLIVACAPAALTPTGGLLAAAVALVLVGAPRLPRTALIVAVLNLPWIVPSALHPGGGLSDPFGITLFSARAENWGGTTVSVLGLGGIWNGDVAPVSRGNPLLPVFTVAMVAVALFGLRILAARWGAASAVGLTVLGAAGVLFAVAATLPFGADVLEWATRTIPGAGLLRDAQKWAAWWALPFAVGVALGVERLAAYLGGRRGVALLSAAALFPAVLLPDLAFAGWGRLSSVDYPPDWEKVATILREDSRPGDVLTLPLSTFRRFDWNGGRTQLDPAPRFLPRTTVLDDTLIVGGVPIPGEDKRMAAVRAELDKGGSPGAHGFGWVLVEHGTPGPIPRDALAQLEPVHTGPWLTLYRVPGQIAAAPPGAPWVPVLVADIAACGLVIAGLLWWALLTGKLRRRGTRARREE